MTKDKLTIADFIPTAVLVVIISMMALGAVDLALIYSVSSLVILALWHGFRWLKGFDRKKRIIIMSVYFVLNVIVFGYFAYIKHFSAKVREEVVAYVENYYEIHNKYPSKEEFRVHFPRGYGSEYQMTMLSYGVNEKDNFYQIIYVQSFTTAWDYYSMNGQWNYDYR